MEDKEFAPEGVSPEPEPVQPAEEIAAEAVATEVPVEDTAEVEPPAISVDELMGTRDAALEAEPAPVSQEDSQVKAVLEAIVYVADEPLTLAQIAASLQQPPEGIKELLDHLTP